MTYQLGYANEQEYEADCALEGRNARMAAQACNAILTLTQANVLKLAIDAMPEAAAFLAETAFETYGWPDDRIDSAYLNEAGRATWAVFVAWRAS